MKNLILAMCVFLISCTNGEANKEEILDPLHFRKEIAALNLEFSTQEFFNQIEKGDNTIVDLFLKAGMSPNTELDIGFGLMRFTPLISSIKSKKHKITLILLKAGAEPNILIKQENGRGRGDTPVTLAIELVDAKSLKDLLENGGNTDAGGNKIIFMQAFMNMGKFMNKPGRGGFPDMYQIIEILNIHEKKKKSPNPEMLNMYTQMSKNLNLIITEGCSDKEKLLSEKRKSKSNQEVEVVDFVLSKCN